MRWGGLPRPASIDTIFSNKGGDMLFSPPTDSVLCVELKQDKLKSSLVPPGSPLTRFEEWMASAGKLAGYHTFERIWLTPHAGGWKLAQEGKPTLWLCPDTNDTFIRLLPELLQTEDGHYFRDGDCPNTDISIARVDAQQFAERITHFANGSAKLWATGQQVWFDLNKAVAEEYKRWKATLKGLPYFVDAQIKRVEGTPVTLTVWDLTPEHAKQVVELLRSFSTKE
jgi:hypothetical protein